MEKEDYIKDIRDIKEMMERSSKFISLSSYSGVLNGIFGLIGSYLAYKTIFNSTTFQDFDPGRLDGDLINNLLLIGSAVLILSLGSVVLLTSIRAKRLNLGIWDAQSKRVVLNLAIPLVSGGILCLIFLLQGFVGLAIPMTLIFYGLALVNASKYTLTEIRSLGIIEIVLGLAGTYFIKYGIFFWAFGFGVMHIIYGIVLGLKYER